MIASVLQKLFGLWQGLSDREKRLAKLTAAALVVAAAGVPDLTLTDVLVLLAGETLGVEGGSGQGGELVEHLLDGGPVQAGVPGHVGLHVVVLDVDGEQPERRHVPGVLRHDDPGEVEDVDEPAREQRPRPAEGGQHEVAHVEPALHRHLTKGVRLVPRGDLEDAGGAPFPAARVARVRAVIVADGAAAKEAAAPKKRRAKAKSKVVPLRRRS